MVQQYILQLFLFKGFQEWLLGFVCRGQEEVWCLFLLRLHIRSLVSNEVPFISIILERRVTCRQRRQERSFLREIVDDILISISSNKCLSLCLWYLVTLILHYIVFIGGPSRWVKVCWCDALWRGIALRLDMTVQRCFDIRLTLPRLIEKYVVWKKDAEVRNISDKYFCFKMLELKSAMLMVAIS